PRLPRARAGVLEGDLQPIARQRILRPVGPLADRGRGLREQIVEPEGEQLGWAGDPVEIDVLQRNRAPIEIDQRERRRGGPLRVRALRDRFRQQGLPRAQLAGQGDEISGSQRRPQPAPECARRGRRLQHELADALRARHRPQRRNRRGRPVRTMSVAISGVSPISAAARSPAIAWRKTARRARSAVPPGAERRARTAAAIPVRTSPEPAVAIPGLPWAQMALRPSGSATTVWAPFSTTQAPNRCAARTAASIRSERTRSVSSPVRRPNSP